MNKVDFVEEMRNRKDISYAKAELIFDTVFGTMKKALADGERIEVRGMFSMAVRDYPGYLGRNPKTGEAIMVAPKKLPFFKVGRDMICRLNPGKIHSDKVGQVSIRE